ncbi:MAG: sodium:proline symporter, partial [Flavobacteriales bacterium]|nr:sodium:proline symporter [Flavobacteriales bacterium]
ILEVFFELEYIDAFGITLLVMLFVAVYSSLSGLKGVAITDAVQFTIAMVGCIILAIVLLNTDKVGGISGLKEKLPAWRFEFFPDFSADSVSKGLGSAAISIGAFLTFSLVQWWASWYPGAEPGGGGYVAQRLMSTKDEKAAQNASLFFNIAHYCLRPWPWIIIGLCIIVLYPDMDDPAKGFIMSMRDYLSPGIKGLLLVAFFGAYMSTISTQLNWGSSFLTNDLYKRFIQPKESFKSEEDAQRNYVFIGRLFTLVILLISMVPTFLTKRIDDAAQFLIQSGGGIGLVLILRWFWWRISAWSEIFAILGSLVGFILGNYILKLEFPASFLFTVGFTTLVWLVGTFATQPVSKEILLEFYNRVRPIGFWSAYKTGQKSSGKFLLMFANWIISIIFAYAILFLIGKIILQEWSQAGWFGLAATISFLIYIWLSKKE